MEGGCTCRQLRYRLNGSPIIVHACHCRWCQRETGTAFALNALYEADRVTHLADEPDIILTPSLSGKGQRIARCPGVAPLSGPFHTKRERGAAERIVSPGVASIHRVIRGGLMLGQPVRLAPSPPLGQSATPDQICMGGRSAQRGRRRPKPLLPYAPGCPPPRSASKGLSCALRPFRELFPVSCEDWYSLSPS